jgi:protein gp37
MTGSSKIEWTDSTWNPVTGCTKISPGCQNCYAERMAHRLKAMGQPNYRNDFELTLHEHMLSLPLKWAKPQMVFVCSMSDLFHKNVPTGFILKAFDVMSSAPQHRFQVLTKRSRRLVDLNRSLQWPENVWVGVSVENSDYIERIDHLRQTDAAVKFISFEPLIGPVNGINLKGIDWAIVGGESGPGARPMDESWVIDIRDNCSKQGVPFFFKQWGGVNKKKTGRLLEGEIYEQMPHYTAAPA